MKLEIGWKIFYFENCWFRGPFITYKIFTHETSSKILCFNDENVLDL